VVKGDDYKITVGLEIHAELKTRTKMFCNSKNDTNEKHPNVNVCPVCMGYPGTLPVINKEAVKHIIKVGIAVGGEIADYTEFDRKNYFYPDIPKGYQISQYKHPLVKGGVLNGVKITRIHLEEDTARSSHDKGNFSLVDFNRAGIPLIELVTEPVISSAPEASSFAKELQLLFQTLGVAEANMEKGEMRVEANISVSNTEKFGIKVEVKNLNSFRSVERAIAYEVERHVSILKEGGQISQETRGWDEVKEITFSQRAKEESHDYRYFPDPDLPKLIISEISELNPNLLKKEMPELPWERRERYLKAGLKEEDSEMFTRQRGWGDFFDKVALNFSGDKEILQTTANFISSDLVGIVKNDERLWVDYSMEDKIEPKGFAELILMFSKKEISSRATKDILRMLYEGAKNPRETAEKENLIQKNDESELKNVVEKIISENKEVVAQYRAGKTGAIRFLVGQGMKVTKGSGNPAVLLKIFREILSK